MRMVILFGVPFILVLVSFGFLLWKEYRWIKNCDENTSAVKRIALWFGTIGTAVLGLCVIIPLGFLLMVATAMQLDAIEHSKIVNLNSNTEVLAAGDTWNIDDLGSITINDITKLSAEEAQEKYNITPKDPERYYEVSFAYENIAFEGYFQDRKVVEDEMYFTIYVSCRDDDGNMLLSQISTRNEKHGYFVNQGSAVKNDRFLIVDEHSIGSHNIELSFTVYTPDKYGIYRQAFWYEVQ